MSGSERNSSFEALRIICILMIIAHHFAVHGSFGPIDRFHFSFNGLVVQMLSMYGRIACSVFVLITGYFSIYNDKINLKKTVKLVFDLTFYTCLSFLTLHVLGYIKYSNRAMLDALLPMFKVGNWFVVYYILFSLFIPFINPFLRGLEKAKYIKLLSVIYIVWSVLPFFMHYIVHGGWYFSDIDFFFVMYITGAFIRLHGDFDGRLKFKGLSYKKLAYISFGLILASVAVQDAIGIFAKSNFIFNSARYFMGYNTLLAVLFAVYAFLFAKDCQHYNPTINKLATSVLAVYLIHDNNFTRPVLWNVIWPNKLYFQNEYFILLALLKKALVFVVTVCIDKVKEKLLDRHVESIIDRYCRNYL